MDAGLRLLVFDAILTPMCFIHLGITSYIMKVLDPSVSHLCLILGVSVFLMLFAIPRSALLHDTLEAQSLHDNRSDAGSDPSRSVKLRRTPILLVILSVESSGRSII